jgi:tripartite-type tricarboxylate transporter receptor subunit TctC
LPGVPTFAEAGVPSVNLLQGWAMFAVPVSTPSTIVTQLHQALSDSLNDPDTREKLTALGVDSRVTSLSDARRFLKEEIDQWGAIIRRSGVPLE